MRHFERFLDFATEVLKAEGDNWAGRANVLGLVAVFALLYLPTLAFDALQAVARLWDEQYETGLPSTRSILGTFGYLWIACVSVLVLGEVIRQRRR